MGKLTQLVAAMATLGLGGSALADEAAGYPTQTPIKHLIVIFQENVSFDHYFYSYPSGKPTVATAANKLDGDGTVTPLLLTRSEAATTDQNHGYLAEQLAFDDGKMDQFPKYTGATSTGHAGAFAIPGMVMNYFDRGTVAAMWNYAGHYAMSDNYFATTFGPSTPGAINLVSGQTNGAIPLGAVSTLDGAVGKGFDANNVADAFLIPDGSGGFTVIGDGEPAGDVCANPRLPAFSMSGPNIGSLLSKAHRSWGFFSAGFALQPSAGDPSGCFRQHHSEETHTTRPDYIPHHEPFQYYADTRNPAHLRPSSSEAVGHDEAGVNHQYDLEDFYTALKDNHLPAVSYLKAPAYQDGHAGYSDPVDEQAFVVDTVNRIQASRAWKDSAIIITYDDSDGWYDHVYSPAANGSGSVGSNGFDGLERCKQPPSLTGVTGKPAAGRCGYGPRLPLLVLSPYARSNYIDHDLADQTSILRFVEDNWLGGERIPGSFDALAGSIEPLFDFKAGRRNPTLELDPSTGEPKSARR